MFLEILFVIIGIIGAVIVIVLNLALSPKLKKLDVVPNSPMIEIDSSRTKFTEGYSYGVLKHLQENGNDTFRLEFYPFDISQGENIPLPDFQTVIVRKEFLKRLARGDQSTRREVIKTIPRFLFDIPDKLRETKLGEQMTKDGQKAFMEKIVTEWVRGGDEAMLEYMIENTRLGMTKKQLKEMVEKAKTFEKLNNDIQPSQPQNQNI